MMIRDCKLLARFYQNLVDRVSSFSYEVSPDGRIALGDKMRGLNPVHNTGRYRQHAHEQISSFVDVHSLYNMLHDTDVAEAGLQDNSDLDTWIFPTVQMGPFDIVQDEEVIMDVFSSFRMERGERETRRSSILFFFVCLFDWDHRSLAKYSRTRARRKMQNCFSVLRISISHKNTRILSWIQAPMLTS